jgi:urease alpha subunit
LTIDVIIKGGTCVSHIGVQKKDIAIRDGIIVALGDFGGDLNEVNAKEIKS